MTLRAQVNQPVHFFRQDQLDKQRDLFKFPDAKVLAVVVEYALVTKAVKDRADHATASPHKICEFLLGKAEMLPKPCSQRVANPPDSSRSV